MPGTPPPPLRNEDDGVPSDHRDASPPSDTGGGQEGEGPAHPLPPPSPPSTAPTGSDDGGSESRRECLSGSGASSSSSSPRATPTEHSSSEEEEEGPVDDDAVAEEAVDQPSLPRGDGSQDHSSTAAAPPPVAAFTPQQSEERDGDEADKAKEAGPSAGCLPSPLRSPFPRVMDISELIAIASRSRSLAAEEEETKEAPPPPTPTLSRRGRGGEGDEPTGPSTEAGEEDRVLTASPSGGGSATPPSPLLSQRAVKVEEAESAEALDAADAHSPPASAMAAPQEAGSGLSAAAPPPVHEHEHEHGETRGAPTAAQLHVRRLHFGDEDGSDAHVLRLRRTLLSAFPLHVRRYYSLNVKGVDGTGDDDSDEEETIPSPPQGRFAKRAGDGDQSREERAPPSCRPYVPCGFLEGGTLAEVCAAAAAQTEALLHHHGPGAVRSDDGHDADSERTAASWTVERSCVPDVPKALPRLLDHLCEDKYYVNGAWQRYREDTQFIKAGASGAVRKRRRAGVLTGMLHHAALSPSSPPQPPAARRRLGHSAASLEELLNCGDGGTAIPTPRTAFSLKDWRTEAAEAVKAYNKKLLATALAKAPPQGGGGGGAGAAAAVAHPQVSLTSAATAATAAPASVFPSQSSSVVADMAIGSGGGGAPSSAAGAPPLSAVTGAGASGRRQPLSSQGRKHMTPPPPSPSPSPSPGPQGHPSHVGEALSDGKGTRTGCEVTVYDVFTKEVLGMYARYAMSSGRLRHEVTDPFSTLTLRVAELERAQLLKKL